MRNIIKNTRKGITIMEMVIALTVIAIISGAALSIILSSLKVESRSAQIVEVTNLVESSIECFQYSSSVSPFNNVEEDEYYQLLKKINNVVEKGVVDNNTNGIKDENDYIVYKLVEGVKIIQIFYYNENEVEIDAYLDGELIYNNVKYKKG